MEQTINLSRYTDTKVLRFTVEFVTPCFLGGADENAELRAAPFKNALRYWWRVLYGNKYSNNILQKESDIFGSTEKASKVIISINPLNSIQTEKKGFPNGKRISVQHNGREMKINILDYLAYGKYEYVKGSGNVYPNTYITPGCKFQITIQYSALSGEQTSELEDAVLAFTRYGGVGSRSHNGFGSLKTEGLDLQWSKNVMIGNKQSFPILSEDSRLYIGENTYRIWEEALSEAGILYKEARNSLDKPHVFQHRGLIARPIISKFEKIPDNVRNDRIPKFIYLGVIKNSEGYRAQILSLPILFYEEKSRKDYEDVVKAIHLQFSGKMTDATSILRKMGGVK